MFPSSVCYAPFRRVSASETFRLGCETVRGIPLLTATHALTSSALRKPKDSALDEALRSNRSVIAALPALPPRAAKPARSGFLKDEAQMSLGRRAAFQRPPLSISEPSLRLAGGLLFARFRCWEHPGPLRGTIKLALFLPGSWPTSGVRQSILDCVRSAPFGSTSWDVAFQMVRTLASWLARPKQAPALQQLGHWRQSETLASDIATHLESHV